MKMSKYFHTVIGLWLYAISLLLLSAWSVALNTVTVTRATQYIYDKSPKLRIRGSGFSELNELDIQLELSTNGQPSLIKNKDYILTKDSDGDGLILKLLSNRSWADLSYRVPPVALVLNSVKVGTVLYENNNLLDGPAIVAQVLNTPSVIANTTTTIYQSVTNELRIYGSGFIGSKSVNFYFNPPLVKEVAYEDVTPYPLRSNCIVLRLRHGYTWRESPGSLIVIGVDTGGGPVKVNGDDGVIVANVVTNQDNNNLVVVVDDTAKYQLLYENDTSLLITGHGFNPVGNTLRFANGLLGNHVNYSIVSTTSTSMTLSLVPGSVWRKNHFVLPSPLTLLAINVGMGFVSVGPVNSGKGRDVATIYKYPRVLENLNLTLFRTYSNRLRVFGEGFPLPGNSRGDILQVKYNNPDLIENIDFSIELIDETYFDLVLLKPNASSNSSSFNSTNGFKGKGWLKEPGILRITHINPRGDGAGWVKLPGIGVRIAQVISDYDDHISVNNDTSLISQVVSSPSTVYQSALRQSIVIIGLNFPYDPLHATIAAMEFDPPLQLNVDFEVDVQNSNKMILKLKQSKKWRISPGYLTLRSFTTFQGVTYEIKSTNSTKSGTSAQYAVIARVLSDPTIVVAKSEELPIYHESQSKLIAVQGMGVSSIGLPKVTIRPTSADAFQVVSVSENKLLLKLKPGRTWLPSFMSLVDEDSSKKIAIQITAIDTGAGWIEFDEPVSIGFIVKDRIGVLCDDSCEFAFDGVCDDSTAVSSSNSNRRRPSNHTNSNRGDSTGILIDSKTDDYYYSNDDAYGANDGYQVSACAIGTDCTDCGGVDAISYSPTLPPSQYNSIVCSNTCIYARDGICDDSRGAKYCDLGTDCQDCGPVGADNFTRSDDDGWWDDDDDDDNGDSSDSSSAEGNMFGDDLNLVAMTSQDDLQFVFDVNLRVGQSVCSIVFPKAFRKTSLSGMGQIPTFVPIALSTQFHSYTDKYPPGSLRILFGNTHQYFGGCVECDQNTANGGSRVGNWPKEYLKVINGSHAAGTIFSYTNPMIKLNSGFSQVCVQNTCVSDGESVDGISSTNNSPTQTKKHKNKNCGKTRWIGKIKLIGFKSDASSGGDGSDSQSGSNMRHDARNYGSQYTGILVGVVLGVGLSFIMLVIYHKFIAPKSAPFVGSGIPGQGEVELQGRALAPMAVVSGAAVHDPQLLNQLTLGGLVQGTVLAVGGVPVNASTGSVQVNQSQNKVESEGLLAAANDDEEEEEMDKVDTKNSTSIPQRTQPGATSESILADSKSNGDHSTD